MITAIDDRLRDPTLTTYQRQTMRALRRILLTHYQDIDRITRSF